LVGVGVAAAVWVLVALWVAGGADDACVSGTWDASRQTYLMGRCSLLERLGMMAFGGVPVAVFAGFFAAGAALVGGWVLWCLGALAWYVTPWGGGR
jgi:hypothetical protein